MPRTTTTVHRHLRRLLVAGPVAAAIALTAGSGALAHIVPDPAEAPAGSAPRIAFTVEHGCDGSPTIQLDMRIPDGMTDVTAEPPPGWAGGVDAGVVTFTGGPLPADVEGTFAISGALPSTPDVTIYFPFVQRCEQGEIRWIDVPSDGSGDDLDEPAPAMRLTAPVATTAAPTTAAPTTAAPTTAAATTAAPTTAASTTAAATTESPPTTSTSSTTSTVPDATTSSVAPTTTIEDDGGDDGGGDSGAVFVAASVGAAALVVAGLVIWQIRRRS
jgi:uncharacterized protein YcnI